MSRKEVQHCDEGACDPVVRLLLLSEETKKKPSNKANSQEISVTFDEQPKNEFT